MMFPSAVLIFSIESLITDSGLSLNASVSAILFNSSSPPNEPWNGMPVRSSKSCANNLTPPLTPYLTPPLSALSKSPIVVSLRFLISMLTGSVAIACAAICSFLSSLSILAKSSFYLRSTSLSNSLLTAFVMFPTVSASIP